MALVLLAGMLDAFFEPIEESIWAPFRNREELTGGKMQIHGHTFPSLANAQLAIIGAGETADQVRKEFYKLTWRFDRLNMVDLGNLVAGNDAQGRQFALSEAIAELLDAGIKVMVLGQDSTLLYGYYQGYRNYSEPVEVVHVSHSVDLDEGSVLRRIIETKPSVLFNMDFLATQSYYISAQTAAILDKMYFENHRLGELRSNIEESEPLLRSAHLMMFDMNAVRYADAPGTILKSPNGLYAEEAARLARYAGISNKLSSVYVYGLDAAAAGQVDFMLQAQMLWYFVDGFCSRFHDHPSKSHPDFIVYRNRLSSTGHEIVFYKSIKSNRWWMEIPHPYEKKSFFIGCSYKDYESVCHDEMPDRWWRAYQRLM